ncbi:MAG: NAD(+)/NADH kinase, partial [Eggerthellaceae bacterium]|nr:NAD(+)/NADH kinase [Eggerthellaceae bacterium]
LFGRGNQQLSAKVLRRVGKENILIVATRSKLKSFYGSSLLVDTGDEETDRYLCGYYRVLVAGRQETVLRLGASQT